MGLNKATDSLAPVAISIISLVLLIGVGAVTLSEMQSTSYTDTQVLAEQDQPTAPFPSNYTLDGSTTSGYQYVVDGSVTVTYEDASAGTNTTLTEGTDYDVYYDAGEIEVANTSTTTAYDDTADHLYTDYEYESESQATGILSDGQSALDTFSSFFQVIVVVAVAAVIFMLLAGLRKAGGKSMA